MALFNHRAKTKERQYNKGRLLEVVVGSPVITSTTSQYGLIVRFAVGV